MTSEVYTRDSSSGKVHRRIQTESGELMSFESDNLDDAGAYEVIDALQLADVDPAALCERCFPALPDKVTL